MSSGEMTMRIRATEPADHEGIVEMVRGAFTDESREGREEVDVVLETWARDAAPDGLDLVADDDGVVGHVVAGRGQLAGRDAIAVAPLSVSPTHQRQGIGTALMNELLVRAEAAGWPFVLLLGDPDYYGRFDFEPAGTLGIVYPPVGAGSPHFQVRRLRRFDASAWRGSFTYCWELP
jgi:putative acetyltransferase